MVETGAVVEAVAALVVVGLAAAMGAASGEALVVDLAVEAWAAAEKADSEEVD